jgi:hypothetical protein
MQAFIRELNGSLYLQLEGRDMSVWVNGPQRSIAGRARCQRRGRTWILVPASTDVQWVREAVRLWYLVHDHAQGIYASGTIMQASALDYDILITYTMAWGLSLKYPNKSRYQHLWLSDGGAGNETE